MGPSYKFETFIHECDSGEKVRVIDPALQTAPLDFGLTTEETILSFVAHESNRLRSSTRSRLNGRTWESPNPT